MNFLLQLKNQIKNLKIKLDKTKNLKTKLEILHKINNLKSQLTELLELEHKSIEAKYDAVTTEKIRDIKTQMQKDSQRRKFMQEYRSNLEAEILIKDSHYLDFIDKFWIDIMSNLDKDDRVLARFMVQLSDTSARTFNKTEILENTLDCLDNFKEIIKYNLNNIYEHYLAEDEDNMINGFIMSYHIWKTHKKVSNTVTKKATDIKKGRIQRTVKIININHPLSTNPSDFGSNIVTMENITVSENKDKNLQYVFDRKDEYQNIQVSRNSNFLYTLTHKFIDLANNLFQIISNNISNYVKDGKIILKTKEYDPKFIKRSRSDKAFTSNFYTADIETLTKLDSKGRRFFESYPVAFYDGTNSKSYYVTDYLNWEEMMNKFFKDLFNLNIKDTDIYFHNLSGFDINFLLKPLLNIEGVKSEIMLREGKWISVKIKYGDTSFNFKDSLLILPGSLMNLSKSFKIQTPKGVFPRKLVENETFEADFITANVPDYNKYFNKSEVSLEDYNKYCELFKGKVWSLKNETLKYVDIDCIALHQILIKFGNMIFDRWGVDIKTTPTLPALCFKIYRSKYMPKDTIPIITGIPYRDIKQAYTGGSTDMYIPYGENIWCYDVNSLYPASMSRYKFPVGKFISFQNLNKLNWNELENLLNRKLFGFLEVEVNCPKEVLHPILQIRRVIDNNSEITFAPVGSFKGWFHTEELKEAIKLGYKINIISGYLFEEAEIFNDYINDLYRIKVDADKNKDMVWRLISKNLMNSLYGRFGMNQYLVTSIIIDKDDIQLDEILDDCEINEAIELNNKMLIQYFPKGYDTLSYQKDLDIDISIPVAASVTAYSRIIMSSYKNNSNFNLHYTDTDSLYVNFKSDSDRFDFESKYVDPLKLGYLKIENFKINGEFVPYERFYFLGPKFYVGILNNKIDFSNKTKIRGLQKSYRSMIDEDKIKSLLDYNRKPIKIETMKWFKDVSTCKIIVDHRPYNLDISVNKRSLVWKYNSPDNIKLINTFLLIMKFKLKKLYFSLFTIRVIRLELITSTWKVEVIPT